MTELYSSKQFGQAEFEFSQSRADPPEGFAPSEHDTDAILRSTPSKSKRQVFPHRNKPVVGVERRSTFKMDLKSVIKNIKTSKVLLPAGHNNIDSLKKHFKLKRKQRSDFYHRDQIPIRWHKGEVTSLAFSNSNEFVITASADRSIQGFGAHDEGKTLEILDHHQGPIKAVALSSNDLLLASGDDSCIKVCEITDKTKNVKKEFPLVPSLSTNSSKPLLVGLSFLLGDQQIVACLGHRLSVFAADKGWVYNIENSDEGETNTCFALLKQKNIAITGTCKGNVRLSDLQAKKLLFTIEAHGDKVESLAVSKDEKYLITADMNIIKVFDIETAQQIHTFDRLLKSKWKRGVSAVAISSNGKYIVSTAVDGAMKIVDLSTNQETYDIDRCHDTRVTRIILSSDDKYIITAAEDGTYRRHIFLLNEKYGRFPDIPIAEVLSIKELDDNSFSCIGKQGSKLIMYNTKKGKNIVPGLELESERKNIRISDDQKYCALVYGDSVKVYDLENNQEFTKIMNDGDAVEDVVISSNNKQLIILCQSKKVKIFLLEPKTPATPFETNLKNVSTFQTTPNNQFIIFGSSKGSIVVFNSSKKEEHTFYGIHRGSIHTILCTSDSKNLVSLSEDGCISFIDIENKTLVYKFVESRDTKIKDDFVTSISISQNDKYLIVGLASNKIKVYNLKAKQFIHSFEKIHEKCTKSNIIFTIQNKYIVSCSANGDTSSMVVFLAPFTQKDEFFIDTVRISPYIVAENVEDEFKHHSSEMQKNSLLLTYQDFCFHPFGWTVLHYLAVFEPALLTSFPSYSEMKVPFLVDSYGKTPLHYLLANDQKIAGFTCLNNMLKYIMDYIEQKTALSSLEYKDIIDSLSPIFPIIISDFNSTLAVRFADLCLKETCLPYGEKLTEFGGNSGLNFKFSLNFLMDSSTQRAIHEEGTYNVVFKTLMLKYDYNTASQDILDLVLTLDSLKKTEIFKTAAISNFIAYLWGPSKRYHIIMGILFSVLMVLMSVYYCIGKRDKPIEIIILVITSLFTLHEIIQIAALKFKHFTKFWNYADLIFFPLIIIKMIQCFNGGDDELTDSWIFSIVFLVGYVRWASYLQIFKSTRNLNWLILLVVKDMWPFMLILCFIIVGSTVVFVGFHRGQEYYIQIFHTYSLLYGAFEESDFDRPSQKVLLSFVLFFLSVILLNLLISIMGDSYGRFQQNILLIENQTRIDMILEYVILRRWFKSTELQGKGYLMSCGPKWTKENEKDNEQENEHEMKALKMMEDRVNQLEGNIKALQEKTEKNHMELLEAIKSLKKK